MVAVFAYGLAAMLAAWSVFYADVKFIVSNFLGLWFFLTPVLYPLELVLNKTIESPDNWVEFFLQSNLPLFKKLYVIDPLTIAIEGYRSALLHGGDIPIADPRYPFWQYAIGATVIAVATAILGHIIFRRKADAFAEQG